MLIQLVGPMACGKTELRRRLCPNAVHIGSALYGPFNAAMLDASGYWFQEMTLDSYMRARLEEWMASKIIRIDIMYAEAKTTPNPGIWIYEGLRPIAVEPTMIWEVNKRGLL